MTSRFIRLALAASIAFAALIVAQLPGQIHAQSSYAQQTIAQVNAYRAAYGLNTLTAHPALMTAAQNHADWMVATGNYGHTGENGSTPADRAKAAGYPTTGFYVYENWVGGGDMQPAEAISWWDSSPVHHQTLTLSSDYQHIGVGVNDSTGSRIYVLLIAKPSETTTTASSSSGSGSASSGEVAEEDLPSYYVEPIVQAEADAEGTIIHTVGEGQTAWAIAAIYGVDLDEMLALNGLQRPVFLYPGDTIVVKLGPNATLPARASKTHVVQDGESAWTVAAYYGITLDQLLEANQLERPAILQPGDVLTIPPPQPLVTATPIPTPQM